MLYVTQVDEFSKGHVAHEPGEKVRVKYVEYGYQENNDCLYSLLTADS